MDLSQNSSVFLRRLNFDKNLNIKHHAHGTHDGSENKINCSNNNF